MVVCTPTAPVVTGVNGVYTEMHMQLAPYALLKIDAGTGIGAIHR